MSSGEFDFRRIGPGDDKSAPIDVGDEVVIRRGDSEDVFKVEPSDEHEGLLKLVKDDDSTEVTGLRKAAAYFGREVTFKMVPEAMKGEEGRRFRRIAAGLGAAAAAGLTAYVVVKHRKK